MVRQLLKKQRRAAIRIQAAFRRWAGRKKYLANLAESREQAKLENQVKALQAKLAAKEQEARELREGSGEKPAEMPMEMVEKLKELEEENAKLREDQLREDQRPIGEGDDAALREAQEALRKVRLEKEKLEAENAKLREGDSERPEVLEMLNTLTAENEKLRSGSEKLKAELEKLREESRHLRQDRAAKDELVNSLRPQINSLRLELEKAREEGKSLRADRAAKDELVNSLKKELASAKSSRKAFSTKQASSTKASSKASTLLQAATPWKTESKEKSAEVVEDATPSSQPAPLQLYPPLSPFWEDVPSEMLQWIKDGTEVHLKLGQNAVLLDERDDKRLIWRQYRSYRRSMAFVVERRAAGEEAKAGSDDSSIGEAFALRSAMTGRYVTYSAGVLATQHLRVASSRPEEAAVFTYIPLVESAQEENVEYLGSVRLLSEKKFLRLRTDGHVGMMSVNDPEADVRNDKMAVSFEKLLPRASYEIVFDEDQIGISLGKGLRVCSIASLPEPSCAERSGRVHVGDVLTSVNGQDVSEVGPGEIVAIIACKRPITLGFAVGAAGPVTPAPRDKEKEKRTWMHRFGTKKSAYKFEGSPQKAGGELVDL